MKRLCALTLLLALLLPAAPSLAAGSEARDVADKCTYSANVHREKCGLFKLKQLRQYWNGEKDGVLTVTLPREQKAQGIMLSFHTSIADLVVESLDGEAPAEIARYAGRHYNDYIAFSQPAHSFRIRGAKGNRQPLRISRMHVLTEGKLPSWVQKWDTMPEGEVDLMLIATHPDDDILWFGGLLPTYAGQLKKKVLVAYASTGVRLDRRNELLDALWHCGVTCYPSMPKKIRAGNYVNYTVDLLRRYKPLVVVTQDINGEYGHPEHKKLVAAVTEAVESACLLESVSPASAKKYGVYQPQKLYLHLWKKNQSKFDWNQKLSALGNKTGIKIAREAFKMHVSQQNGRYAVLDAGRNDCSKFGLYFTTVGKDDTKKPDFLQHVKPRP